MKITVLGTGTSQGIPVIGCKCNACISTDTKDKRLRCSIFIESDTTKILIDTTPDFRYQMLRYGINKIDAILYTHEHNDHTAGLDDIRPINFLSKKSIPLYGLKRVLDDLQVRFKYATAEENRYPGAPRIDLYAITPASKLTIGDIHIMPLDIRHGTLEILGYRIGNFAYITDISEWNTYLIESLTGVKHLIVSALQFEKHYSHFTIDEALEFISFIKPEKAYLTHLSHKLGCQAMWSKNLPNQVEPAYDGLVINVK